MITVGLDGTDHSLAAVDWAAREATRRGDTLRLVHARIWRRADNVMILADEDAERRWAEEVLSEGAARVARSYPELTVSTEVLADDPVPGLVAEAEAADLLVLGSRGFGTLTGYLIGSISTHVLRQTNRPVVMVRPPRAGDAERPQDEVVVGVPEEEDTARAVLEYAFASAAASGASVRAVRAWGTPVVLAWGVEMALAADTARGLEATNRDLLATAVRPFLDRYPDVKVLDRVELGSPAEVLLEQCERASLVVVGRHAKLGPSPRRIGSVAHAVLHHAPAPVAVIPPPAS
ncbi:universal stress protein [Streptomyces sp. NPDC005438]|uniref:universal stress protein n=1 Tax=Streptomyces sp. NPDC005438 TaxID=3156880 RepID=UPI0033B312BC